jgi:hypothetical protein
MSYYYTKPDQPLNAYNQLCCIQGITDDLDALKPLLEEQFDIRVKMADEYFTLPTPGEPDTGGRRDILFYVHDDDTMKFAVPRLQFGIRWWEDILGNGHGPTIPQEILDKYPNTWT